MTPQASALLDLLTRAIPPRQVYRAKSSQRWFVTYRGGEVTTATVKELVDLGKIVSVYSNCPQDSYHVGRTIDVERSMEARRQRGKSAPVFYVGDTP